ncbi:MAG TPA: peptidoglycan DD-metalloendopeptidase family protein [Arenicellales bacterium]|nr:peptidoglycan DD-metalloendopeptidase family protein [Arenicellales bacterium]
MLDSKHAAAPLRRSRPKTLLAAVISGAVAVTVWAGTRALEEPADTPHITVANAETAAAPAGIGPDREYTQPGQQLAKAEPVYRARRINPHPPSPGDIKPLIEWKQYSVQRGDSLGRIFSRFSIDIGLASRIVEHETAGQLKKLMPGHEMSLGFNADGDLVELRYELDRMQELVVRLRQGELIAAEERQLPTETRERSASLTIGSSLFGAAAEAGLSDRLVMELVSIFGWDIDFALDIRTGDRFTVLYEELVRDGSVIGTGDIIAAEFINDGSTYHAVRHVDDSGRKRYFDLEGNNLRGTFLRTPMKVSRVTSGFSKRRYHPVLKKWRAHKGVDYGAPTGTPVLATGDGRIHSIGRNGGYGNAIVLKHGGQYSTLYAHLSGFRKGLKRGARVSQGEVIGYVGATGMVTGPHLHYEFRVNGQHRDPLAYETPRAEPIAERYREEFLAMARSRINQLADLRPEQVASR